MMRALSALGDTALLAPASLLLLAYLAALRRWPDLRALVVTLAAGLGATLVSKLLFKACGGAIDVVDLNSPSGHASFATLFYGSLTIMLVSGCSRGIALAAGLAAAALVFAIGASRVVQGMHSSEEVVVGWLIGLAGLAIFLALRRPAEVRPLPPVPLAIGLALAIIVVDGRHFSPEHHIGRIARKASAAFDICLPPQVTDLKLGAARTTR